MLGNQEMKVSVSITDLPLLTTLEHIFAGVKETGADGVEITPGVKSRWHFGKVKKLSDKYELPITAVHQPLWSIGGLWFDEGFLAEAAKIGVKNYVFHPPSRVSFDDGRMIQFLARLSDVQKKYKVSALLENMPWAVRPKLLRKYLPYHADTCEPKKVYEATRKFGLGMTLDTSHLFTPRPHMQKWFSEVFPGIKNIHLSSFTEGKDHLPLDMGNLETSEFIEELERRHYQGLVTLEIFYPKKISLRNYDFDAIKRSVDIIKT